MARTVTAGQKHHALQALEIAELEVAKRKQELQEFLDSQIPIFRDRQGDHVDWLPKQVREMSMREFSQKYNGNVQFAASASAKHKPPPEVVPDTDKSTRKRKWISSVDSVLPASKNARLDSPHKKPLAAQKTRLKSLSRSNTLNSRQSSTLAKTMSMLPGSPSPTKWKPTFSTYSRPPSPLKQMTSHSHDAHSMASYSPTPSSRHPIPSAATFNMTLPPKTPVYPTSRYAHTATTNPATGRPRTLKRTSSRIVIRKDTSPHSQDAHASSSSDILPPSSQTPTEPASSQSSTQQSPPRASHPIGLGIHTPINRTTSYTGMITIPMKGGQHMEFDPFQTSPGELDALEGITNSTKKHAKDEMGRLIQATMSKWRIGNP